jgi:UDPglucose 6-dehydrogenase
VGFGGSCFQKDLLSLIYISESYGLTEVAAYWQQVVDLNQWQKRRFADLIAAPIADGAGSLRGRRIAILGFAFKKDTNDVRETPAMDVCRRLLARGATLAVHDYRVTPESVRSEFAAQGVEVAATPEAALAGADGVAVLTEWSAYATLDWARLAGRLKVGAVIHDGRNILDAGAVRRAGLILRSIGRGAQPNA